jgi:hypothetical protein
MYIYAWRLCGRLAPYPSCACVCGCVCVCACMWIYVGAWSALAPHAVARHRKTSAPIQHTTYSHARMHTRTHAHTCKRKNLNCRAWTLKLDPHPPPVFGGVWAFVKYKNCILVACLPKLWPYLTAWQPWHTCVCHRYLPKTVFCGLSAFAKNMD